MTFTHMEMRNALIRVKAKKFANRLATDAFGWAENIPKEDLEYLESFPDEEFRECVKIYTDILEMKRCVCVNTKWSHI